MLITCIIVDDVAIISMIIIVMIVMIISIVGIGIRDAQRLRQPAGAGNLSAPANEALHLKKPCRPGLLQIVARGAREEVGGEMAALDRAATQGQRGLAIPRLCSLYVRMAMETIGQAWSLGWRVHMRCAFGRRGGMKSIRECQFGAELDLETLVCTRGRDFPLSLLANRLRCPRCGSRQVRVLYDPPRGSASVSVST